MANGIKLHRVLRAAPSKVYKAFTNPAAVVKWLPPNGFTCTVHAMDVKVGGTYRMSFTNFGSGKSHSFGGKYLELVPGERLRYTDKIEVMPSEMMTTITFKEVSCGTELTVTQENLPDAIPPEMCYLGWQESLVLLGKLVEADNPD